MRNNHWNAALLAAASSIHGNRYILWDPVTKQFDYAPVATVGMIE